jgi:hypothetical protein
MSNFDQMLDAYIKSGGHGSELNDSKTAHLVIDGMEVKSSHVIEGLELDVIDREDAKIKIKMVVKEGYKIEKPVRLCFGVIPEEGIQEIEMKVNVEDDASVTVQSHCTFPNAVNVKHVMDADILIGNGSEYRYIESHFHGENGGVEIIAKSKILVKNNSYLLTNFNLLDGRAGNIKMDYDTEVMDNSTLEMLAKMTGYKNDFISIREAGKLSGKNSRGVLESRIALRDNAKAEILSELTADAPGAKGHVDCMEIIKDNANAKAIPIVDVRHPEAKVTHEAAIGSVDSKQLQTLMARGLDEEEATEVIIQGLLS